MPSNEKIRVTFSCSKELQELLTTRASVEGIPRGQLIVELLEDAMQNESQGTDRSHALNRLMFDIQQRIGELEAWKNEVHRWNQDSATNSANLEETVAYLLNQSSGPTGDIGRKMTKKSGIPTPKSGKK